MSNATQDSREPGNSKKRRRSRGGQNRRNNNNQQNRRGGQREPRNEQRRSEEFRPRTSRKPHKPVKLTWWQKLLKTIGLYKEPAKPERPTRQIIQETKTPKSNTRNARSENNERQRKPETSERPSGGKRERSPRGGNPDTVESSRVYVGNLSYDVSEQDLQELFKGVGTVRNVEIVYNRTTHRSKGYGFVEMLHVDDAKRSVEVLHDQFFMGRQMVVSGAKSKGQDDREDQESRNEAPTRPVVVAPLTPAASETSKVVEEVTLPIEEPATPEVASTDLVTPVIVEEIEKNKTASA